MRFRGAAEHVQGLEPSASTSKCKMKQLSLASALARLPRTRLQLEDKRLSTKGASLSIKRSFVPVESLKLSSFSFPVLLDSDGEQFPSGSVLSSLKLLGVLL